MSNPVNPVKGFHMTLIKTALSVFLIFACLSACKTNTSQPQPQPPAPPKVAGPLPDSGFKAEVSAVAPPERLRPGQVTVINIKVKNASDVIWWQRGGEITDRTDNKFYIAAGNKWLDKDEQMTSETEGHNGIPKDLKPGEETEMTLQITAPKEPGEWFMLLDMVQEGVTWFHERGSTPAKIKVQIVK